MNDYRRRLIFQLASGYEEALIIIHSLECLKRRDEIYRWLIRNDVTGQKLIDFAKEHKYSWNRMGKFVLGKIEKEKPKALYVGRDVL